MGLFAAASDGSAPPKSWTELDYLENFLSEAMVSNAKDLKIAQDSKTVSADIWRKVGVLPEILGQAVLGFPRCTWCRTLMSGSAPFSCPECEAVLHRNYARPHWEEEHEEYILPPCFQEEKAVALAAPERILLQPNGLLGTRSTRRSRAGRSL